METSITEASYPSSFRKDDATIIGQHLKNRHSVVLIGIKRVGISNFLRFFLHHKDTKQTYIADGKEHLFIPIDLNDLVEREIYPFWVLTLKRIADTVEHSTLKPTVKKFIAQRFLDCIQSKDLFYLIDSIRESLVQITSEGVLPTIVLLRFDRMKTAATPEFFANILGLKDATHQNLSYVFTSVRDLPSLSEKTFSRSALSLFAYDIYLKPANKQDTQATIKTFTSKYSMQLSPAIEDALLSFCGGYNQYVQLALILLHEQQETLQTPEKLKTALLEDERITLQSEEIWESLELNEQLLLEQSLSNKDVLKVVSNSAKYLWETGLISNDGRLFSPLFEEYVKKRAGKKTSETTTVELSKKENLLFSFLKLHTNEICEREDIISAVWPEEEALGVSDWAIDRLVSRVRVKLKEQQSPYEIQTIRTRGYKLISK